MSNQAADLDIILVLGQEEQAAHPKGHANVLQQKCKQGLLDRDFCKLVGCFVQLWDHVGEGDVQEHPTGKGKDVLVGKVQLSQEDPNDQANVASAS